MNDKIALSYSIKGIKLLDGDLYVPFNEIIVFCQKFSLYKASELLTALRKAKNNLEKDSEKNIYIPSISTKKSFLKKLFE